MKAERKYSDGIADACQTIHQRFEALAHKAPFGVALIDQDGSFAYTNARFSEIFGHDQHDVRNLEEWCRRLCQTFDHQREAVEKWMSDVKGGIHGESSQRIFRVTGPDGANKMVSFEHVKMDSGENLITCEDITVRENSRAALQESESILRTVLAASPVGIGMASNHMIVWTNEHLKQMTGYMENDLIGQSTRVFYETDEEFNRVITTKHEQIRTQVASELESRWRCKNGSVIDVLVNFSPILSGDNSLSMVFTAIDITDRKTLEKQILHAQKMEAVGTLAGGIAHDFNNILQIIIGFSELMYESEGIPEGFRADALKINESATRGAELVQRLLTFSKKTDLNPHPLDLNRRIVDLRIMLERTIPKMIHIELCLSKGLSRINADSTQIDQLLMNLTLNARDAMPEGGLLIIETANIILDRGDLKLPPNHQPGPHILLTVTDTGPGMDGTTLSHIFEPFYTTKAPGKGSGLGLAMVHGIVEQQDGFLIAESRLGKGTSFKVYFPAIQSDIQNVEQMDSRPRLRGSETILLVDDDVGVRDCCQKILEKAGYKLILACDGREALEVYNARREEISLVLLDLMMPEMSGKKCLEKLFTLDPSIKVVIISGFQGEGNVKDLFTSGAEAVVYKPFTSADLLEIVKEILE